MASMYLYNKKLIVMLSQMHNLLEANVRPE